MHRYLRQFSVLAAALAAPAVLYLPFRLIAQSVCTVSRGGGDDFAYPLAIALWPAYSLACSLAAMLLCVLARFRWYAMLAVFFATVAIWDATPNLDAMLGIPAGGLNGFRSYWSDYSGLSTPLISVMATNYAILIGAPLGIVAGVIVRRGHDRRRRGFPVQRVGGSPEGGG